MNINPIQIIRKVQLCYVLQFKGHDELNIEGSKRKTTVKSVVNRYYLLYKATGNPQEMCK